MKTINCPTIKDLPISKVLTQICKLQAYVKSDNVEIYELKKSYVYEITLVRLSETIYPIVELRELIENEEDIIFMSVSKRLSQNELIKEIYQYRDEDYHEKQKQSGLN